jgi:hypothetical protein
MAKNKLVKAINYEEEFNQEVQKLFLDYLLSDPETFALCRNILNDQYFDPRLSSAVRLLLTYADENRGLPSFELIKAKTNVPVKKVDTDDSQRGYILSEIEKFCRYKALQGAIIEGAKLLENGQGGDIERLVKDAMGVSLTTDLGLDYFSDPAARLRRMADHSQFISTGWAVLDHKLGGGFVPGALNVFCGGSGSGKSLFLQNISLNWALTGKNVVYISLELGDDLIGLRLDAMLSNRGTRDVFKDIDDTARTITLASKGAGKLCVKRMKEGSNTNDIRVFLKEYQIQTGIKVDAVVLDYLDLLHPNNKGIDVSNLFIKDKYTSEEFRGFLEEFGYLSATASQLNRGSVQAQGDFDHSHIAGGLSKINTCDNMFGINASAAMKDSGYIEVLLMKCRTSGSVGQMIRFGYNAVTMRISDPIDEDVEKPTSKANLKKEFNKPKAKTAPEFKVEDEDEKESKQVLSLMEQIMQKNKTV